MNVRNYIHLTGNLGATPTTFVLPSGDVSCTFNLATNEYYRNKQGKKVTRTEWHRIKAYGKLAELFVEHLEKGSQISIVGAMRYRKWTDKFEQSRITPEVIASEFTFLGASRKSQPSPVASEFGESNVEAIEAEIEQIESMAATRPQATAASSRKRTASRRSAKQPAA
ncbi:single-stranded DNA-binding protein [Lewinella sp. 4G2]|uniref:single-stranded DNA-binding protein n=1 Tax=Lewinella sp. 4G2 TaxID=1803372 RepID=UPI0007B49711|nr:single-stranded DNA-binding protein [Lewinella sp. 4G2]OAV43568.1 hypothetical protein A3850_003245 [Lewinella sp. 4G2]